MNMYVMLSQTAKGHREPAQEPAARSLAPAPLSPLEDYEEYITRHGHHFTEELAEVASALLVNSDSSNHTWTCGEVEQMMRRYGYNLPKSATMGDVCYLVNMAYADYYPTLLNEAQCFRFAYLYINDADGYEGQAFLRWLADTMGRGQQVDWASYV